MRYLAISVIISILAVCLLCEPFIGPDQSRYRELIASHNKALVDEHNQRSDKSFTMQAYPQFIELTH